MERMNGVMNVREAELKEVIKINHEEIAYWKNKTNNAEAELDQVKRENKRLEEENKKLKEKIERLEFDVDAWYQLKLLLE
jgi:predicted  nucleic acid-binding Zn-ribbon protein